MGGLFGIASKEDCIQDLYYGTDYHSHLGTKRGGMATQHGGRFIRFIHNIENAQFRSKFEQDIAHMRGNLGIGIISDYEDQPLLIRSHLGDFALVTVGVIKNVNEIAGRVFGRGAIHFAEMSGGEINPTEMIAALISQEESFEAGIQKAQEAIEGSCSLLLLTEDGIYAARDRLGRTPVVIGKKDGAFAATLETCAFPNLDFEIDRYLGPGEIAFITPEGVEQRLPPQERLQICAFLWVYYGYPASSYEGINVESVRYRCGAALAKKDDAAIDLVAGIPDSGTGHGLGYAGQAGIPFQRPYVKYTPTWPRSFMPQEQTTRDVVARMKLIPIQELIRGKKILFCEDSIVRGTQLQDTIKRLYQMGAQEIHMRPACPPLVYGCKFLNFSRSRSELDLAARKGIRELEGDSPESLSDYAQTGSTKYQAMVDAIANRLNLTSLKYQELEDLVAAIGLPKEKVCTFCWDGVE
ncbi:MAG: amidophosphoribosyltransferase [Candidatus Aminicenantes bacterium]|nr:amidophosphoribosyltransferase [Candidatus Aminicenantes bacterium]